MGRFCELVKEDGRAIMKKRSLHFSIEEVDPHFPYQESIETKLLYLASRAGVNPGEEFNYSISVEKK